MRLKVFVFACCCVLSADTIPRPARSSAPEPDTLQNPERLLKAYDELPMSFEVSHGQTDAQVQAVARGRGYTMFVTGSGEAVFVLQKAQPERQAEKPAAPAVVRMKLLGGNPTPRIDGLEELPGKANYFIGNDPKQWRTNVPTYAKVGVGGVYPGVDLVYYGKQQLEHDFIVAPGADPSSITIGFDGQDKLALDSEGNLVLTLDDGDLRFQKPVIYQEVEGLRKEVMGGYVQKGRREAGFVVAAYDRSLPLVIDPVLIYSTYLGGSGFDRASSWTDGHPIAVDSFGNAYVTGNTTSTNFPTTAGV
jgi:hypothetical protein